MPQSAVWSAVWSAVQLVTKSVKLPAILTLSAATAMPALAADKQYGYTPATPGLVLHYRLSFDVHTDRRVIKRRGTLVSTALKDSSAFVGVPTVRFRNVTRMEAGAGVKASVQVQTSILRREDGNVIARLNRQGLPVERSIPHAGTYAWPMFVGKTWKTTVTRQNLRRNRSKTFDLEATVAGVDKVELLGRSVDQIKIHYKVGKDTAMRIWVVPDLGIETRILLDAKLSLKFKGETYTRMVTELVLQDVKQTAE